MAWKAALLAVFLLGFEVLAVAAPQPAPLYWVGSWGAAQQLPEPQNSLTQDDLSDATLRQIIHLSIGGETLRVHLSNAFGITPLHLTSVHIALPLSASTGTIIPATDKALSFSGRNDVTVPAGAEYISDPVNYPVAPLSDLAISIHFAIPPLQQTGHPGSRSTSYLVHGDLVSAAELPPAKKVEHWYQIAAVDVAAPSNVASIVVLGDSITDGHGATTNGNNRWTDVLAQRLQANPATRIFGVLNEGIGGNRILLDGLGPNALARIDRDVLAQAGIRYLIILEGINDLGMLTRDGSVTRSEHETMIDRILAAYEQIVVRAHTHGVQVIGATLLPDGGSNYYHPTSVNEVDRQAINQWIRTPGHFDAVVDFDNIVRDPGHPDYMLPSYDSGDHLHPSPAGYRVMGEAIPLSIFSH